VTIQVFTTTPLARVGDAADVFAQLEQAGYDGGFTYESSHDPFLPLALAATTTTRLRLGTSVAIGFARTPMTLANVAYDLQQLSQGRFILGLGSQIRAHITKRYSMPWSRPAARMREMVLAIRAIWDSWDGIAPLAFDGEFYTHTLMTPAFNPGPHEFGRAKIHLACVGPLMTSIAAEVGDGVIVHPFNTRRSLETITMPNIDKGLQKAGRSRSDLEVLVVCMVATGRTAAELDDAVATVRGQLAFYGSTPAYAPILECHGFGDLQPQLNALSKQGRWEDMAGLVPDELVEAVAVVALRDDVGAAVRAKVADLADGVSVECTRRPDPDHFADIVASVRQ
jgi:probable F420-dependent oxidoreductase